MKIISTIIMVFLLSGCYSTLHYGYLPGGDYKYYAPLTPVDLEKEKFRLEVLDNRQGFNISCSSFLIDRNTELEGKTGFDFFNAYVRAMIEANNGVIDPNADQVITVELRGLSAEYRGFIYVKVFGLIEFNATLGNLQKTYCSQMADGDEGSPVSAFSFDTRKGALRKMVSGSTRRALEEFIHDIAEIQKKKRLQI